MPERAFRDLGWLLDRKMAENEILREATEVARPKMQLPGGCSREQRLLSELGVAPPKPDRTKDDEPRAISGVMRKRLIARNLLLRAL